MCADVLKLDRLASVLQRFVDAEPADLRGPARASQATSPRALSPVADPESGPWADRQDTVAISSEAVFRFAAANFNPRRVTAAQAHQMVAVLHDGGAISTRDRQILGHGIDSPQELSGVPQGDDAERNLLAEFQARHARDMGRGDPEGVEANGRALAVLGRLDGQRQIAD